MPRGCHSSRVPPAELLLAATWGAAKSAPPAVHVQISPSAWIGSYLQQQYKWACRNWVEYFSYPDKGVSGKGDKTGK